MNVDFSFLPGSSLAQSTSTLLYKGSLCAGGRILTDLYNNTNSEQKRMPLSQSRGMKDTTIFITNSEVSQEDVLGCPEELSSLLAAGHWKKVETDICELQR